MRGDRYITDYLHDIVHYAEDALEFTKDLTFEVFKKDKKTVYAVVRSLETISEAARKIPDDFRKKHPEIPWTDIAGMRDKLVHDYTGIDLEIVWKTAREDIPQILKTLRKFLKHT